MSADIPESDWRRFKEVHQKLLERFCSRTLDEVAAATQGMEGCAYDRYVKVYKLIRERDKELAKVFDDFRRSTAVIQLGMMQRMKLLTDEELSVFSEQTRAHIEAVASL